MANSLVAPPPLSGDPYRQPPGPKIAAALVAIQKELQPLVKSATNDEYDSGYVPLEEAAPKAHQLLTERDIALSQPITSDAEGRPELETILVHTSGESFMRRTRLVLGDKQTPQGHMSAITYMRRGALMSTIGMTGRGEDDDGNKAAGVFAPVTEDQLDRIKSILKHLKWPKNTIAAELFKIKTRDHAYLAIKNYEQIVAQKVRDDESKENAAEVEFGKKIPIKGTADKSVEPIPDEPEDPLSPSVLTKRIRKLGLRDKAAENKLIHRATGKPLMATLKKKEDFAALDQYIKVIESGVQNLPAEFYPPAKEPRIVNEDVA